MHWSWLMIFGASDLTPHTTSMGQGGGECIPTPYANPEIARVWPKSRIGRHCCLIVLPLHARELRRSLDYSIPHFPHRLRGTHRYSVSDRQRLGHLVHPHLAHARHASAATCAFVWQQRYPVVTRGQSAASLALNCVFGNTAGSSGQH